MQAVNHKENIIEVQSVFFAYNGNEVLHDINLTVHRGDYLGIVGGNGTGKTTLLRIILGLLKPSKGSIKLFGRDIANFKDWSKIGYVPQKVTSFDTNFPATVLDVVLMGRFAKRGLFRRITDEDKTRARDALEQVEMWQYRDRLIGDLSGGQQQRVFIARALAGDPEAIFLDEPTVGVDQRIKEEFYALLRKLNEELHLTIILITHDIEGVSNKAMHIACIDRELFYHDSVDEYFSDTHHLSHPERHIHHHDHVSTL